VRTITVVGASLAGLSTVRALRDQGFADRIVVVGDESHPPYDRPPLSKGFLDGSVPIAELALAAPGEDLDVDWRLGVRAEALRPGERTVLLADGSELRSDAVVIATGARARRLPGTAGIDAVHTLRTLDDAVRLRAAVATSGRRLVVVGGGFIGSEVAATASAIGHQVSLVEPEPVPLSRQFGVAVGGVLADVHREHGVQVLTGVGVAGMVAAGKGARVDLTDGRALEADVVLVAVGAAPAVEWLAGSGLDLAGGVSCDARGVTSIPGVLAVGDVARGFVPYVGAPTRIEHWTHAMRHPSVVAGALLSGGPPDAAVPATPPYVWSDQYDLRLQFAGHTQPDDAVEVVEGSLTARNFAAIYRRGGPLGRQVAVLAMNRARDFGRLRRTLQPVASPSNA
jgi:NADPH-dependent 2,4-dienoyl-CoA reductase/sulfur reductase-like enzyme